MGAFGGIGGRAALGAMAAVLAVLVGSAEGGVRSFADVPVLEDLTWSETGYGIFTLEGQVTDEYPEECVVHFGGALSGHYALCNPDGSFSYTVELGPLDGGLVSAQAFDNMDQGSNVLTTSISTYRPAGRSDGG